MILLDNELKVRSYSVNANYDLSYTDLKNDLWVNGKMILEGEYSIRGSHDEKLLIFNEVDSTSVIYDIKNSRASTRPYSMNIIGPFRNEVLGIARENGEFNFSYFSNIDLELVRTSQLDFVFGKWKIYREKLLIIKGNKEIKLVDLSDNSIKWENSIKNISGGNDCILSSNIIFYKSRIFFYIVNKESSINSTFVISFTNGNFTKQIFNFTGSIKEFNGLLYTSHEKSIQVLDPETYEMKEIDLIPELTKNGFKRIDYEKWFVEDHKLYFAQNIGDNIAKIGVFDLKTETIIDKVDLFKENGTVGTLKKSENRLYVHTQDKTLHVFELDSQMHSFQKSPI